MSDAYTIYWTKKGAENVGQGNILSVAGGTDFKKKMKPGDRIYVTNISEGQMYLLGAFSIGKIWQKEMQGKPVGAIWDAPEYLVAEAGSASQLKYRVVPTHVVKALRFRTDRMGETCVTFNTDNLIDGQALRSIRRLTPASGDLLEGFL